MNTVNWKDYITNDPAILYGKPVIKNTRIPVDLILEKLAAGNTTSDLLKAYPSIKEQAITACLLFASESIKSEIIYKAA